ncbi:MAG: hypothetical protein HZB98_07405 [Bacteroidia bacterium]|nr:hypothetical protein [Bacteroidia bacterium]
MNYTQSHTELKSIFSPLLNQINISWSGVRINNVSFQTGFTADDFLNIQDHLITENKSFSYPVFSPPSKSNKVILLLHGLNERSWIKYLAWAHWLSENTSSYVVLFPISFHINRSPESWKDPRSMVEVAKTRNLEIRKNEMSSFANVALSNRLTEDPMRFFNSGQQTVSDLVKLLNTIRSGRHEIIPQGCRLDIFAYSIGAFLAEILMLADPENLFSDSRLFIFCGGSVFSNMNGRSKLIMDSHAFDKVYNFYLNDFENSIKDKGRIAEILGSTQVGMAFRSMIDRSRLRSFRENRFRKLRDQIKCIILAGDTVIPPEGVVATLSETNSSQTVKILDFPFAYSHENPFPVLNFSASDNVDGSFETIFEEAGIFFG